LKKFNTENAGINPALAGEYQVTRLIMSFLGWFYSKLKA